MKQDKYTKFANKKENKKAIVLAKVSQMEKEIKRLNREMYDLEDQKYAKFCKRTLLEDQIKNLLHSHVVLNG